MANHFDQNKGSRAEHKNNFIEILGDTVSGNQLIISIILSVSVSLGGYRLGQWFFPRIADEGMVNSYSLLLGITGTIIILIVCSIFFKPKRILIEDDISSENMLEVFKDLQLDYAEELRLIEEDPMTKKELEELGVLSNFNKMGKGDGK